MQKYRPADPSSWPPAPAESFNFTMRLYGPETSILSGSYRLPRVHSVECGREDEARVVWTPDQPGYRTRALHISTIFQDVNDSAVDVGLPSAPRDLVAKPTLPFKAANETKSGGN